MRILFINHAYAPSIGGCEITTARLAAGLMQRGHECMVVCGRHDPSLLPDDIVDDVPVKRFDFDRAFDASAGDPRQRIFALKAITTGLAAVKQKFQADVVHLNLADSSAFFHLRTEQSWTAPTIINPQESLRGHAEERNSVTGALFHNAARVVAHSSFAADGIAASTSWNRPDIDVIYPGVPAADFDMKSEEDHPAKDLIFIGRLVPHKGADVAIKTLTHLPENTRLTIVGNGPERQALDDLSASLNLSDRVQFFCDADDAKRRRLLASAYALLEPSRHEEQFGMIAVEGGLAGLPVVASAIGGLPEIVVDGETGSLASPGDDLSFAEAVAHLLHSPQRARAMGAAGRRRCETLFTVDRMVASYERVYLDAMSADNRRGSVV